MFFSPCRHLLMGQPAKVMYILTSAAVQRPKAVDLKPVESVTPGRVPLATVDQPEPEPVLPAGDQDKGTAETSATEGSSEEQSSLPALSSSCTSEAVSDLCDQSAGNSESLDVRGHEAEEKQTKPE